MAYLTFNLDRDHFAVNVLKAREVLDVKTITRVPQCPRFMLGVINLRGGVVPVIDLRLKFGLPQVEITRDSSIIVMEVVVEDDPIVVGALVDSVDEVLELEEQQIEPPPRIGTRLKTEFIQGMGSYGEKFIILLDIDRVFSAEEIALIQNHREEPVEA